MSFSLSVLIPVRNADVELDAGLQELFDVLPDLVRQFDIAVIDDASQDATAEVAADWAGRYPQLRLHRLMRRVGMAESLRQGALHSKGEVLMAINLAMPLVAADVHKLWWQVGARELVVSRTPGEPMSLPTWKRWFAAEAPAPLPTPGIICCRRRMLQRWLESEATETLLSYLVLQGCLPHEVVLPSRAPQRQRIARVARVDEAEQLRLPGGMLAARDTQVL